MTKAPSCLTVREQKAEALDVFSEAELARVRAIDAAETAKLRALRLARDPRQNDAVASADRDNVQLAKRQTMHLRSVS